MNRLFLVLAVFPLLFVACGGETQIPEVVETPQDSLVVLPPLVQAPVPELNPDFESQEIDAELGGDITITNSKGSVISIPKGVLVDSARTPISGKVKIAYREMHNAASIFLAGIPLDYDAAGMMKHFETAGLFEIRAEQNGQEVFVDSGKTITINFAGKIVGGDYHLFYLDENLTRNWHYIGDEGGILNPEKNKLLNTRRDQMVHIPIGKEYFTFNYMAALDVFYNDSEKLIEVNRNNPATRTKISEYGLSWTNIYNYQKIEYEGKKVLASMLIWKNLSAKAFPEWSAKAESKLEHLYANVYELSIETKDGKSFSTKIEAYMAIKSLFAKSAEEWKTQYNQTLRKIKEDEARIARLADVYRTMEIHDFGIYSYSRYLNETNKLVINADFNFESSPVNKMELNAFYISGTNRSLIKFPYSKWSEMILIPDPKAKLMVLLPDRTLAFYASDAFRKIDFKKLRESATPGFTFEMKNVKKLESEKDLKELLGIE